MPRSGNVKKRVVKPDPLFNSRLVHKLINQLMVDGKKASASSAVYSAIERLGKEVGKDPIQALEEVVAKVTPKLEVRSRRVGGATYQVPMPVRADRGQTLAIRWIVEAARKKKGASVSERLFRELTENWRGEGGALKKKEEVRRAAEANRAFAHFRW